MLARLQDITLAGECQGCRPKPGAKRVLYGINGGHQGQRTDQSRPASAMNGLASSALSLPSRSGREMIS
jgi:hypothetical protein